MAKVFEEISNSSAKSAGKTDSNLANDSNHLGGIPADEYATRKYVQDYHNTREASQKVYIDSQGNSILESAKEYTNSQIRNQDFSSFAEIKDVQALDTKLLKKIKDCKTTCASNLSTQISNVVADTNANFQDVNNAINSLNENQNNLFQSVSSGKTKIAGAITDKGVSTSANASFDTMATNIRNIKTSIVGGSGGGTGDGDVDPNVVNTSDANATSDDILLGKTAYVKGKKVFGTLINNTVEGEPTYGLDTKDATASPSDVIAGKTFYARGQKMTGSLYDTEIEEIYGVNSDNPVYKELSGLPATDSITDETVTCRDFITFSKNLDFMVCVSKIAEHTYVESYAINDNGLYIQGTTNVAGSTSYKKYRYSYEDLGLEDDETITDLELSAPGFMTYDDRCLLIIATRQAVSSNNYNYRLHIYTYNLTENGVIGRMYPNQISVIENHIEIIHSSSSFLVFRIACFNLQLNKLYAVLGQSTSYGNPMSYTLYDITLHYNINNNITVSKTKYISGSEYYLCAFVNGKFKISSDDKYATFINCEKVTPIIYIDNGTPRLGHSYRNGDAHPQNTINIKGTNLLLQIHSSSSLGTLFTLVKAEVNETTNYLEVTHVRNLFSSSQNIFVYGVVITDDNKLIITRNNSKSGSGDNYCYIYDFDDFVNSGIQTITYSKILGDKMRMITDNNTKIFMYSENSKTEGSIQMCSLGLEEDLENVIGLKYKGDYFYRQDPHILTAGQPDVRAGKTFIGWMGTQEVGTMEVGE